MALREAYQQRLRASVPLQQVEVTRSAILSTTTTSRRSTSLGLDLGKAAASIAISALVVEFLGGDRRNAHALEREQHEEESPDEALLEQPEAVVDHELSNDVQRVALSTLGHFSEAVATLDGRLVAPPFFHDGKLVSIIERNGVEIVRHGDTVIASCDHVIECIPFEGEALLLIFERGGRQVVSYNGVEGKAYRNVYALSIANDQPLYAAQNEQAKCVVVHGRSESKLWDDVRFLEFAHGQASYVGDLDGTAHIVHGKRWNKAYDRVFRCIPVLGDYPSYLAMRNRKGYVVRGKHEMEVPNGCISMTHRNGRFTFFVLDGNELKRTVWDGSRPR
ncbi:MAG: hypothetical protein ABIG71_02115 [Candidatus Uhrbacteria bacterium]